MNADPHLAPPCLKTCRNVKVAGFVRFRLGKGIEKAESDFAAEVASMAG